MYYSNQTLRHKTENRLASLCPRDKTSTFNWSLGEEENNKTRLIDEDGNIFSDDYNNWTHVEDWFGRPVCAGGRYSFLLPPPKKHNKFVNIRLKEFLVLDEERKVNIEKAHEIWFNDIIKDLDELNQKGFIYKISHNTIVNGEKKTIYSNDYEIRNPFADGSNCPSIREYFIDKVNAIPLILSYDKFIKGDYGEYYVFKYKNKLYSLGNVHMTLIKEIRINPELENLLN